MNLSIAKFASYAIGLILICFFLTSCARMPVGERIASWPDGVNLLSNGSFEVGPFVPDGYKLMLLPSGGQTSDKTIKDWEIVVPPPGVSGRPVQVAWVDNSNPYVTNPATDGRLSLDLTGVNDSKGQNNKFGSVNQDFATVRGTQYSVSFDMIVAKGNPSFQGPITVSATLQSGNQNSKTLTCAGYAADPNLPQVAQHKTCTSLNVNGKPDYFKADSTSAKLTIWGEDGDKLIGLDNVRVECVSVFGRHEWCGGARNFYRGISG